jgi:outer membrane protein OmpA-like peptidoglycan-associated protein
VELAVSPINFQQVYGEYENCVSGLLPVNFGQIEKSILLFKGRAESLTSAQQYRLDRAIIYANADSEVKRFYIDGHTDNIGIRDENLELSKKRAELVADYLLSKGIKTEKIVTRWHGERYPIASNRTAKGRIKNRRVTVRLDKTVQQESDAADGSAGAASAGVGEAPVSAMPEMAAK